MKTKNNSLAKSLILFSVLLIVITSSFAFVILTHEDPDNRVEFSLLDQTSQIFTEKELSGRPSLVYFGFTHCTDVCPIHMATLSRTLKILDMTEQGDSITPVFITVDPERDNPQVVNQFLTYFDDRFIGLTGSRPSLKAAALSFKTYLEEAPQDMAGDEGAEHDHDSHEHDGHTADSSAVNDQSNRQIPHATVVYLLNKYGEVIDYVSADKSSEVIAERIRKVL